jgi:hypothetical protein
MSLQSFDTLMQDVVMYAPSCPEFTALHCIRAATIDFCNETLWWRYEGDPIPVEADEQVYTLEVPNGAEAVAICAAFYDNMPLPPMGFAGRSKWTMRDYDSRYGAPVFYTQETPGEIKVLPVPDSNSTGELVVTVAVRPKRDATSADRDMMDRYEDPIINGALARIYAIPNQPFTNPEMALMRQRMFREGIVAGKIDANKSLTTASLRVQPRRP